MLFDVPLEELEVYRPTVREPADFDAFWQDRLAAAREHPLDPVFDPHPSAIRHADVYDVTFAGSGGAPVKAWLLVPHALADRPAMVVEFVGYGGGRGLALDWLDFSAAGHPHLVMDTRGQGGQWRGSDTPDPHESGAPGGSGFLVRGVLDPRDHYYARLFVDAARAVEAARAHPASTGRPVVTTGASQGGGLALAAAQLADGVAATMPDVPFLANLEHAVRLTDTMPYREIIDYCAVYPARVEQVFATLAYIDVVNHAKRTHLPALFSVGLVDEITPASTVYAAYNHYAGPKTLKVYPFNGHEGGGSWQLAAKLAFLSGEQPGMPAPTI
jgi:cephalosporin-C deacetylase